MGWREGGIRGGVGEKKKQIAVVALGRERRRRRKRGMTFRGRRAEERRQNGGSLGGLSTGGKGIWRCRPLSLSNLQHKETIKTNQAE